LCFFVFFFYFSSDTLHPEHTAVVQGMIHDQRKLTYVHARKYLRTRGRTRQLSRRIRPRAQYPPRTRPPAVAGTQCMPRAIQPALRTRRAVLPGCRVINMFNCNANVRADWGCWACESNPFCAETPLGFRSHLLRSCAFVPHKAAVIVTRDVIRIDAMLARLEKEPGNRLYR
jgi:hypothetical protein